MAFMSIYDPETGKTTKIPLKHNDKSQMGISRVQGLHGVTQAAKGWQSQYMSDAPYRIVQKILDSSKPPAMKPIQNSLLTQKGFNEALRNVHIHNLQKMAMQKRQALANTLNTLMGYNKALRVADMTNQNRLKIAQLDNNTKKDIANLDAQTRRYQIDKNYDVNSKRVEATNKYYQGTLQNQKDRLELDRQKLQQPKQKATTPLDEAIKRRKLIDNPEDFLKGVYGSDIYGEMDSEQKAEAISSFIANGTLPKYTFHWGWVNDTINRESGYIDPFGIAKGQNNSQQPSTPKAPAGITGKMLDSISKELNIDRGNLKISDDGSSVILPDGSAIGKDELAKIVGA